MPRLAVVFDSNAYRSMADSQAEVLREAERSAGILPIANQWVCAELLSHLADSSDKSFRSAWAAIRRLAAHCAVFDGTKSIIRFHMNADAEVLHTLFGVRREVASGIDAYGWLVSSVASSNLPDEVQVHAAALQQTAEFVSAREATWSKTIRASITGVFDDLSHRWRPQLGEHERRLRTAELLRSDAALKPCAEMYARSALLLHELAASPSELERAADRCVLEFPVPLRLYNEILARLILAPDLNLAKRANWLWDIQLAFAVSSLRAANGHPTWLITSDADILDAAREAGARRLVRSLGEYEEIVIAGTESVLNALQRDDAA